MAYTIVLVVGLALIEITQGGPCSFSKIPKPAHAELADFSMKERKAVFSCAAGYVVASSTTRTNRQTISCSSTSGWETPRNCVKQPKSGCKTPQQWRRSLPHLHIKSEYRIGDEIQVTCPKRYHLREGKVSIKCGKSGWSNRGASLHCLRNTCKIPKEWKLTVEETLRDEVWVGQKMLVTCPKPQQMISSLRARGGIIKCLENGKFDIPAGHICRTKGKKCRISSAMKRQLPSMRFRSSYLPGATIIFNKVPKNLLKMPALVPKNDVITCQDNGQWDVPNPFRYKKTCVVPQKWRGDLPGLKQTAWAGWAYVLKRCSHGRRVAPAVIRTKGLIRCDRNGRWNIRTPTLCERKPKVQEEHKSASATCPFPELWMRQFPVLRKGRQIKKHTFVNIKCRKAGLEMSPSLRKNGGDVFCTSNGRWNVNPDTPLCGKYDNSLETPQPKASHCTPRPTWLAVIPKFPRKFPKQQFLRMKPTICKGGVFDPEVKQAGGELFCNRNGHWNIDPLYLCQVCVFPLEWRFSVKDMSKISGLFPGHSASIKGCTSPRMHLHPSVVEAGKKLTCLSNGLFNVNPKFLCTTTKLEKRRRGRPCPLPRRWAIQLSARQDTVQPGVSMKFKCRKGESMTAELQAVSGILMCLPSGWWYGNLDIRKDLCIKQQALQDTKKDDYY